MSLLQRFQEHILQTHLFSSKDKLLVAVSGGVDSVVLCELCKRAGYDFLIAHCNFQLRGTESDRDEKFVNELGLKYGVEVFIKKFDTEKYAAENKLSTQEAARDLRYQWFGELISTLKEKSSIQQVSLTIYLLTAHHADDNTETVIMNFFRGTGLHGLTGIPESAGTTRRPLLIFSKEQLLQFAKENELHFVEDSSNLSSKYTRNFFRNEIIPTVGKVYPKVSENILDNINRFKEIEKLYKFSVVELIQKICKKRGNEIHIPVKQLLQYRNNALIYEIISEYGFHEKQVDEVLKLSKSDSGKYIQSSSGNYRIIKHRHWFIISPVQSAEAQNIIIEKNDPSILYSSGTILIEKTENLIPVTGNDVACLDANEITFPLLLRKWKTSDYFYPLGMKKKKKINRFLIDQKLSMSDKENVWVVESNQRIIWVVGKRIDERFKVTEKTTAVLKLIYTTNR